MRKLHRLNEPMIDGENNPITFDVAYAIHGDELVESIAAIKNRHGPHVYFLPLSGMSGGAGIFQKHSPDNGTIVGLHLAPVANPRVSRTPSPAIEKTALDEIIIDADNQRIIAGAAITLNQLNQTLAYEVGSQFKVLGADLTSYTYAQTGASFMTGGMGPQRRYFSDSVKQIALHNGETIITVDGDSLPGYAGTYGWTGIVSAVNCEYYALPKTEIAFAIPVNGSPQSLARLLTHLSPYAFFKTEHGEVINANANANANANHNLIFGLEHITTEAMEPMFAKNAENEVTRRAQQLKLKCQAAQADGLVFVNGYSNQSVDEFLLLLVDDQQAEQPTIAGIDLEHTEIFSDPELMRSVREAIPFAARTQRPHGEHIFKGHTDANIRLNPAKVTQAMTALWQANQQYVDSIKKHFASNPAVRGQILVYGHLNPYGVDPHNRLTFASDDKQAFDTACAFTHEQQNLFTRTLREICDATDSILIGGEKGAGSEHELYAAFGAPENAPAALAAKFKQQQTLIQNTAKMFNWRAFQPYI